ncbi:hypothetical protein BJ508DRAFT_141192 [Ascobolus immersus RN42]|uniref:Uncharacterized protein n=1 Tax=Ascobolus immersus RN42 TaxID=1160509 RepID=A0A3N4HZY3_ASCIM|nr:hypothetical protein BJ508DRAFT_141192 [Ascobolus immersus RN42]
MLRMKPTAISITRDEIKTAIAALNNPEYTQFISVGPGKSVSVSTKRPRHRRTESSPKISEDSGRSYFDSVRSHAQHSPSESSGGEGPVEWDITNRRAPFWDNNHSSNGNLNDNSSTSSRSSGGTTGRAISPPRSEHGERTSRPRIASRPSRLNAQHQVVTLGAENHSRLSGLDEQEESDGLITGDEEYMDEDFTVSAETSEVEVGDDEDSALDSDGSLESPMGGSGNSNPRPNLRLVRRTSERVVDPSDDELDRGERTSNSSAQSTRRFTSAFRRRHIPYSRHTAQYGQRGNSRPHTRRSSVTSSRASTRSRSSSNEDSESPVTRVHTVSGPSEGIAARSLADSIELQRMRYAPLLGSTARGSVPDFSDSSASRRAPAAGSIRSVRQVASNDNVSSSHQRLNVHTPPPPRRNSHTPGSAMSADAQPQDRSPSIGGISLPSLFAPDSPSSSAQPGRGNTSSWFRWTRHFSRRASRDDEQASPGSPRNNSTHSEERMGQMDGSRDPPVRHNSDPTLRSAAVPIARLGSPVRRSTDYSSFGNLPSHRLAPYTPFSYGGGNPSGDPARPYFGGAYHTRFR